MKNENQSIETAYDNQQILSNEDSEHDTIVGWGKRHKKGLLIAGGTIVAIGAICLVYKNWDSIIPLFKTIKSEPIVSNKPMVSVKVEIPVVDVISESPTEDVSKIINNGNPFPVSLHPRNLSNGRNASEEKIAQAEKLGITLKEHQTWVIEYEKNAA